MLLFRRNGVRVVNNIIIIIIIARCVRETSSVKFPTKTRVIVARALAFRCPAAPGRENNVRDTPAPAVRHKRSVRLRAAEFRLFTTSRPRRLDAVERRAPKVAGQPGRNTVFESDETRAAESNRRRGYGEKRLYVIDVPVFVSTADGATADTAHVV